MPTSQEAALDQLIAMNKEFVTLTGKEAYLYTSEPKPGEVRVVFTDGVKLGYTNGLAWMQALLVAAQTGDWEPLRTSPVVNPGGDPVEYPYL